MRIRSLFRRLPVGHNTEALTLERLGPMRMSPVVLKPYALPLQMLHAVGLFDKKASPGEITEEGDQ